ncbi:hypothetical protein LINGRAHAP2_LOCUS34992 [Linum grandiflorum]
MVLIPTPKTSKLWTLERWWFSCKDRINTKLGSS